MSRAYSMQAVQHAAARAVSLVRDVLLAEVEHALAQVEAFPEASEPLRDGIHRRLLHKFPYALIYSLGPTEIRSLAVAHPRRRPFYWEDRL